MNGERSTCTQTVRQAELEVSLPRKTPLGEPIELIIRLTNHGNEPVIFGHINRYRDCWIQIFDSNQRPCPFTPFGYQKMGGERDQVFMNEPTPVESGESYEWRIEIGKCFELEPGIYTAVVSLVLNLVTDKFQIVVDNLEFEVL